jgi:Flp pilus assembly protein TadD
MLLAVHPRTSRRVAAVKSRFLSFITLCMMAGAITSAPAAEPPKSSGAPVDSLVLLEKSVARDSSQFDKLVALGILYLDRDRPGEAAKVLDRANRVRPKQVKVLVNLGAAHDASGQADQAQVRYREALELAPQDSLAACRLASSLYSQGKHQESVDLLRDTIHDQPRSYCAYFTLGVAFADASIYRDAIRMWRKVIEVAPTSPEAASARESIEVLEKFVQ